MMKQNEFLYCEICDKTTNIRSKSKHINSKSQKHKKRYGTAVKDYEFNNPHIHEVNYILNDTLKHCRNKILKHLNTDAYIILNL